MTKTEMKAIVKHGIEQKALCRMFFRYDANYRYYFPLILNDKLFLGAEEDDFILDGYSVRRFVDLKKLQIKEDKCMEILRKEGIINSLKTPEVDITNWEAVFLSLQKMNLNIIIEKESLFDDEWEYWIGRIARVFKRFVYFYHFDANGIWQEEPYRIPYTEITSVSFGTRYVETYSKYLQ